ncbi:hypothetical protein AVEN_173557-1 [Araneus ventricosus]|uniref:Uncharacterized protein n=1 Tax=Araneus ventricosus TaxID=182803 RepID=A0A4Y2X4E7_ARAVE|nr:hypothetical protein AVEN_173557-1 [Araneus ventricosus]
MTKSVQVRCSLSCGLVFDLSKSQLLLCSFYGRKTRPNMAYLSDGNIESQYTLVMVWSARYSESKPVEHAWDTLERKIETCYYNHELLGNETHIGLCQVMGLNSIEKLHPKTARVNK